MLHNDITGIDWRALETISVDECEVQNRYLDAWLEAKYIQQQKKER